MPHRELWLPLVCAASATAWTVFAARRAKVASADFVARGLLGGAVAFGLASVGFDLLTLAGVDVTWERIVRGGGAAAALAITTGFVEEGAKLAGLLLVVGRGLRTPGVLSCAVGVSAGFAALEAVVTLGPGAASYAGAARIAFAPIAHALLAMPLALGVAATMRDEARPLRPVISGLLASALLHGDANLSIAIPSLLGPAGFAIALLAPALLLHVLGRRALSFAPARQRAVAHGS
jgi:RsiW-degrading membrane proteinase PrsW (M82 family)